MKSSLLTIQKSSSFISLFLTIISSLNHMTFDETRILKYLTKSFRNLSTHNAFYGFSEERHIVRTTEDLNLIHKKAHQMDQEVFLLLDKEAIRALVPQLWLKTI